MMNKVWLVIKREYLTRVKKRSFIIMTFLGPILMASVWIVPFLLATRTEGIKTIEVLDETGLFYQHMKDRKDVRFTYIYDDLGTAKENLSGSEDFGILYIPKTEVSIPRNFYLYTFKKPGLNLKMELQDQLRKIIENQTLQDVYGIDPQVLSSVKADVSLVVEDLQTNRKSFTELSWALGFIGGMLIYIFIFMYGAQVMRGVIEEKTNRIVEIIVSSVKPIQLMLGKIVGIAMVGLTQFLLWILLTLGIVTAFSAGYATRIMDYKMGQESLATPGQLFTSQPSPTTAQSESTMPAGSDESVKEFLDIFFSINYGVIIGAFLFFFIGGYLLYAALFAAVGSAVDSEADTQQFMFPITIPLVLALVTGLSFVLNNPDGSVAYWLSLIPFTSPVVMMIRIPFGVNIVTDLLPSALLLIAGFLLTTWIAARIYRTGILMYGKKISYRDLWKWLSYRY